MREIGVVVPAHDEAAAIQMCLHSIAGAESEARRVLDASPRIRTVVVLDSCTDATKMLVAAFPHVETVTVHERRVGAARAAGARHLLATTTTHHTAMWLANTDADSEVPTNWLTTVVRAARAGTHLVLGTAVPAAAGLSPAKANAWYSRHRLHDGHHHVHGANLGIRADSYLDVGGWAAVASGEDVLLARRVAETTGLSVLRTGDIPVTTSSRTVGRAPHGFAEYLHTRTPPIPSIPAAVDATAAARPILEARPVTIAVRGAKQ